MKTTFLGVASRFNGAIFEDINSFSILNNLIRKILIFNNNLIKIIKLFFKFIKVIVFISFINYFIITIKI